ncbi:MAG: long-chain fatty acid--CoA ligase [Actinobacteria bacterium]|nr:MAG: long-chain fatty acid--CoA ligase [Actinomycetota bacterium]
MGPRPRREVDFSKLRTEVADLERRLSFHGIGAGSTVLVRMRPSLTLLWTVLALWRLNAQVMLVDPRLSTAEGQRIFDLCRPQYHIRSNGFGTIVSQFTPECEIVVAHLSGEPAAAEHCLVQFSSGSTGHPKVIGRTAESLHAELDRFARMPLMPGPGDRVLLLSSLTHSFGLIGGVLHALSAGATLVFSSRPHATALVDLAKRADVTAIFGAPVHFDLVSRASGDLPRLRMAVSAGEALRTATTDAFRAQFGVPLGTAYGMTEVGIIATDLDGRHGPPAVGAPAHGLRTEVRDGELYVHVGRSPYLIADKPGRVIDGWLRTFDLASVDPTTGVISIHGRADSMVTIGGLKVDLTEVESVLLGHERVTEAVVVFGDAIEAHVSTRDGVDPADLIGWCRQSLSTFKVPRRLYVHEALPRTVNGKLVRNADLLRAAAAKESES